MAVAGPLLRDEDGVLTAGAGRAATLVTRVGQCVPLVGRARRLRPDYAVPREPSERSGPVDVGYLYGAAMLVDRRFLGACGGLDERFFLFAEDEDLCRQARMAGRRVVLDGRAEAAHVGGASCADGPLIEAQRLFSTWRLFQKWGGRRRRGGVPSRRARRLQRTLRGRRSGPRGAQRHPAHGAARGRGRARRGGPAGGSRRRGRSRHGGGTTTVWGPHREHAAGPARAGVRQTSRRASWPPRAYTHRCARCVRPA